MLLCVSEMHTMRVLRLLTASVAMMKTHHDDGPRGVPAKPFAATVTSTVMSTPSQHSIAHLGDVINFPAHQHPTNTTTCILRLPWPGTARTRTCPSRLIIPVRPSWYLPITPARRRLASAAHRFATTSARSLPAASRIPTIAQNTVSNFETSRHMKIFESPA